MEESTSITSKTQKSSSTTEILRWRKGSRAIDLILGNHAVSQGVARYFGGETATIRYVRELFMELPPYVAEKTIGWRGFPGQPDAERSIYLRDLRHGISLPLIYRWRDSKVVIPTMMIKSESQKTLPCGGASRMSLVLDYDGSTVVSKLRIGIYFYADTPENRGISYKSPAELSANSRFLAPP